MTKRIGGSPDFVICTVPNIGDVKITLYDTPNVWNKYTFEFTSTGQMRKFRVTVYPAQYNQLIGIASIRFFKRPPV